MVETFEDSTGVQLPSIMDQVVQLAASNLRDSLRCALERPVQSSQEGHASASKETDLECRVVCHVARDDVDVLEMCGSGLQVGGSFRVSNDGEDNSVRSASLESHE